MLLLGLRAYHKQIGYRTTKKLQPTTHAKEFQWSSLYRHFTIILYILFHELVCYTAGPVEGRQVHERWYLLLSGIDDYFSSYTFDIESRTQICT